MIGSGSGAPGPPTAGLQRPRAEELGAQGRGSPWGPRELEEKQQEVHSSILCHRPWAESQTTSRRSRQVREAGGALRGGSGQPRPQAGDLPASFNRVPSLLPK